MALSPVQMADLKGAIQSYNYSCDYYDFVLNAPQTASSMKHLEGIVYAQLTSNTPQDVANGLGNVIYWGNASAGYVMARFNTFQGRIGAHQPYDGFMALAAAGVPSLRQIKALGYPAYSGISFISKVLMFLDPKTYCVLDRQITKLRRQGRSVPRALDNLVLYRTTIPATQKNERAYDAWRQECIHISTTYYAGQYGAAEVERGFFKLIRDGYLAKAQDIYTDF